MKYFLIFIIVVCSSTGFSATNSITDVIENGCGLADIVYSDIAAKFSEKSSPQYSLKSKGAETGRRLLFYSDGSWLLTLEFFSEADVAEDVSCIVAHGADVSSQDALDYELVDYPQWKWGAPPPTWPRNNYFEKTTGFED